MDEPRWDENEARREYMAAVERDEDRWVAACGGTERPYHTRTKRWVLYVWNPALGRHGFLDIGTDIVHDSIDEVGA